MTVSVRATKVRLAQANCMCFSLSLVTTTHMR